MYIGAHVSTSGGLKNALERGLAIGAESLQIFPSAPVQWNIRGWGEAEMAEFKNEWTAHFKQIIFHGIYLVNLAAQDPENLIKSKKALIDTLRLAPKLGIFGSVFHPGNYTGGKIVAKEQIAAAIKEILAETPEEARLVYENSAGSVMGGKLEDLAWLVDVSPVKERVAVCLDTCHAFAAGYDLKTKTGYVAYLAEVDRLIGLDKVFCWHLNDSKFDLGSKRDRHENIGEGKLGKGSFDYLLNDARWKDVSGYLEVPGFDNHGPDKKNVDLLLELRK